MALRYFNTIHVHILEVRGAPAKAQRVVGQFGSVEAKLAEIKDGKVKEDTQSVSVSGPFDCTEAIWLHIYDSGVMLDDILGSCMVLLPMFDLNLRPFEGWLPFLSKEGQLVCRVGVQLLADHTRKLVVSILRGICDPEDGNKLGGATEPYVVMKLRDQKFTTEGSLNPVSPTFDTTFEVNIGFRDRILFQVLDRKAPNEQTGGSEVLGLDLLARVGQYMWIPILDESSANAGKILLQMSDAKMGEKFPIRILQTQNMQAKQLKDGKAVKLYVRLQMGQQEFKTTSQVNDFDPVWDEEFILELFPYESLHVSIRASNLLIDDDLGEAFIPAKELIEHRGEQVWVDLNNTPGVIDGKVLLWICPPPGSVYPDTLTNRKLILQAPIPPEVAEARAKQAAAQGKPTSQSGQPVVPRTSRDSDPKDFDRQDSLEELAAEPWARDPPADGKRPKTVQAGLDHSRSEEDLEPHAFSRATTNRLATIG